MSEWGIRFAGFLKAVVHNVADLDLLLMHNRKYCAEVAHNVSTQKRKDIVQRAAIVRSAWFSLHRNGSLQCLTCALISPGVLHQKTDIDRTHRVHLLQLKLKVTALAAVGCAVSILSKLNEVTALAAADCDVSAR